jgi:hypothetical protein
MTGFELGWKLSEAIAIAIAIAIQSNSECGILRCAQNDNGTGAIADSSASLRNDRQKEQAPTKGKIQGFFAALRMTAGWWR